VELEHDQGKQEGYANGPDGYRRRLNSPPMRLKHDAGGGKGHDDEQHQFRLPG
jgi:hypothetical protein